TLCVRPGGGSETYTVTGPGLRASRISGAPVGPRASSALRTLPRTSAASAPSRVTCTPDPGTTRPTAPTEANRAGSKAGTTSTATRGPGAACAVGTATRTGKVAATIPAYLLAPKELDSR